MEAAFTSQLAADGSGYLTTLPSAEQPTKSVNQDEGPVCVPCYHRLVSGSLLSCRERGLRREFFFHLYIFPPQGMDTQTAMFN